MKTKYRVWWVPQVPGAPFYVDVASPTMGKVVEDILARYDLFQFENKIKPDYCNAGGTQEWQENFDGEGNSDWVDVEEFD